MQGTGMGLPHSGAVCDSAFFAIAESNIFINSNAKKCVYKYYRFKDDILILTSVMGNRDEFGAMMRKSGGFFDVKCEEVNSLCVSFLELRVFREGKRVGCAPHIKITGLNAPILVATSQQPAKVHISWPQNFLKRRSLLCTNLHDAEDERRRLIQLFKSNSSPAHIVKTLERCNLGEKRGEARNMHSTTGDTVHIVLPYSRHLKSLPRAINAWWQDRKFEVMSAFGSANNVQIRIAWSNAWPNMQSLLSNGCSKQIRDREGGLKNI